MRRMILLGTLLLLSVDETVVGQTRTLDVGDAVISYDLTGRGRTVVFIHGWSHNKSSWDDQVPVFSKRYRVLRYDSPGYGASTGFSDASAEPVDLLILLEALRIDHAYIVGLSRGGEIALRFATAYPERVDALVLYGAGPPADVPPPQDFLQMFGTFPALAKQYGLDTVGKLIFASPLAWTPPGRDDVKERYLKLWASYKGKDLLDPRQESGPVPLPNVVRLATLRMPTLVVIGDHEIPFIAAAADTFVRHIPNAKKVVIPNAGHGAHFAQPATFDGALLDFFSDVDKTKTKAERKKKR